MDNQHSPSPDHFWGLLSKKLANEASPKELQELQTFFLNNPELYHQADLLTSMWEQIPQTGTPESEAAYMRHLLKHKDELFDEEIHEEVIIVDEKDMKQKPKFFHWISSRKKIMALAVAMLVITGASSLYFFTRSNNSVNEAISSIVTKNGNRTKIVLPDGTQVWLNAGSNIDYNNSVFNKDLREVTLNGEAYFDVVKNTEKPFIIHTKKMDIKVLGTAFNVRSYNDEKVAEASLIRGTIEVTLKDRKDQKIILKPNEKISIATDERLPSTSVQSKQQPVVKNETKSIPQIVVKELKPSPTYNIISEIAWTQNKLLFEDESLENIAPMMERWFGKKVVIENESLKNLHYYGNFENETIEEVLSSLKISYPFNFRIENDTVIIY